MSLHSIHGRVRTVFERPVVKFIFLPLFVASAVFIIQRFLGQEIEFREKVRTGLEKNDLQDQHLQVLDKEIDGVFGEVKEMHRDQLDFYKFMYRTKGAEDRARSLELRDITKDKEK